MTPAEARKAWVAALRSGHFEQTTGNLHDAIGYCCLGVACRVAIEAGLPVEVEVDEDGWTSFDDADSKLPPSVQAWLGLSSNNGTLPGRQDDEPESLVDANDKFGWDFEQIADLIEAHESELIA